MPPRKTATDDNPTEPPRRSGRIASLPVTEAKPKPAAKVTKKRIAADEAKEGVEGSSAKKVFSFFFFPFFFG